MASPRMSALQGLSVLGWAERGDAEYSPGVPDRPPPGQASILNQPGH